MGFKNLRIITGYMLQRSIPGFFGTDSEKECNGYMKDGSSDIGMQGLAGNGRAPVVYRGEEASGIALMCID